MKTTKYSKKVWVLGALLLAGTASWAQQSIPNGNFEEWNVQTILTPTGYVNSSLERPENANLGTCDRVTDAQNGSYAIRLTTKKLPNQNDRMPGYFANLSDNTDGDPSSWHGGMPISEKPSGIRGYLKHDIKLGDSAFILAVFSKNGVNIGSYFYFIKGTQNTYQEFNFTFSPALSQTPDSLIFGAVSSDVFNDNAIEGSMLQLDNISFTGISNQPADLNGNFENWTSINLESPKNWYVENDERSSIKTTDHYKGTYGVKLESYLSTDEDNNLRVEESTISTGYYTPTSNEGGFPFTNSIDTLLFWYKYSTPGNSKGVMYVTYKKNGSIVGGRRLELETWNSDYKFVAFPIDATFETPDTLIVSFSSLRNDMDRTTLSNAGSILIVDEVQLSSQKLNTGISKVFARENIRVYPNPATEFLHIILPALYPSEQASISILNQLGQEVFSSGLNQNNTEISIAQLASGLYNYVIKNQDGIVKSGRLLVN